MSDDEMVRRVLRGQEDEELRLYVAASEAAMIGEIVDQDRQALRDLLSSEGL